LKGRKINLPHEKWIYSPGERGGKKTGLRESGFYQECTRRSHYLLFKVDQVLKKISVGNENQQKEITNNGLERRLQMGTLTKTAALK